MPLTAFPIAKARVVHITSVTGILLTYVDSTYFLTCVAWFYGIYCSVRLLLEIPHYYRNRVIDLPHAKQVTNYRWPI